MAMPLVYLKVEKKDYDRMNVFSVVRDSIRFTDGYLILTMDFLPVESFIKQHKLSYVVIELIENSQKCEIRATLIKVEGNISQTILILMI